MSPHRWDCVASAGECGIGCDCAEPLELARRSSGYFTRTPGGPMARPVWASFPYTCRCYAFRRWRRRLAGFRGSTPRWRSPSSRASRGHGMVDVAAPPVIYRAAGLAIGGRPSLQQPGALSAAPFDLGRCQPATWGHLPGRESLSGSTRVRRGCAGINAPNCGGPLLRSHRRCRDTARGRPCSHRPCAPSTCLTGGAATNGTGTRQLWPSGDSRNRRPQAPESAPLKSGKDKSCDLRATAVVKLTSADLGRDQRPLLPFNPANTT
jgi:hypothetical protein